jgi:hypothetical protein
MLVVLLLNYLTGDVFFMKTIDGKETSGRNFKIRPNDIFIGKHLYGSFSKYETEASARIIIKFCQQRNEWLPFTKTEIDKFSETDFYFNGLLERLVIVLGKDGLYRVTDDFIEACKAAGERNRRKINES